MSAPLEPLQENCYRTQILQYIATTVYTDYKQVHLLLNLHGPVGMTAHYCHHVVHEPGSQNIKTTDRK